MHVANRHGNTFLIASASLGFTRARVPFLRRDEQLKKNAATAGSRIIAARRIARHPSVKQALNISDIRIIAQT